MSVGEPPANIKWDGWAFLEASLNSFWGLYLARVGTKDK